MNKENNMACGLIYETLVAYENGEIVPKLAESFEYKDDGKTLVFKLKDGVKFSDGEDFNADAVKKILDFDKSNPNFAGIRAVAEIKSTEVIDDNTIAIHYENPSKFYINGFCFQNVLGMPSPKSFTEGNFETFNENIGTGPYVYEEFKLYHLNCEFGTIRELCQDLLEYAKYYTNVVFKRNTDTDLKKLYEDIIDLRMEVSYPFLLKIHHDCVEGLITSDELKKILKLCISYVLRRAICEIPTNSMNKTFATLKNYIRPDDYMNSVKAFFVMQDTYKEFPDNDKFEGSFVSRDIYNMRARNYILSRLENFENKAPIIIENYTIEHIMPQNKNLSLEWKADLGTEWQEVQKKYLHTIGNLTLTAYNSEMSDRPFLEKMDMPGGFKESALRLNKYVVLQNKWNEKHIQERANELAKKAESIWPYPTLTAAELAPYQVEEKTVQKYSLETYDVNAFTRILFESLDKRIMNLSPAVKKEYKKLYVAYKLDTNFVDIVFQKQRLRISINMKFSEINDPNGICKDITGLGRWGNGDVELFMEHQDELDQIMEIVKQSFDAQAE